MKIRFITIETMGRILAEWRSAQLLSQQKPILDIQVRELIDALTDMAKGYGMNEGEIKIKVCYEV